MRERAGFLNLIPSQAHLLETPLAASASLIQDLAGGGFDLSATIGASAGPVGQAGWFVGSGYQGASGGVGIGFGFPIGVGAEATYTKVACVAFCLAGRKSPPWKPEFVMP